MIIPCRFSFVNVFEAKPDLSGRMKYSCQLIIPKSGIILAQNAEDVIAHIHKAIEEAKVKAVDKGKLTKQMANSSKFKLPLRDGDESYAENPANTAVRGCYFINASNTTPPGVVGPQLQPLMSADDFYSGCFGYADIQFFGYNQAGNAGIGASLQNVMKKVDGDRLDGRQSAEEAFAGLGSDENTDMDSLEF